MKSRLQERIEAFGDLLVKFILLATAIIFICLLSVMDISCHKNALEHMVGHRVSWWDAFVTK